MSVQVCSSAMDIPSDRTRRPRRLQSRISAIRASSGAPLVTKKKRSTTFRTGSSPLSKKASSSSLKSSRTTSETQCTPRRELFSSSSNAIQREPESSSSSIQLPPAPTQPLPTDPECIKLLSLMMHRESCRLQDPDDLLDTTDLPDPFEEVKRTSHTLQAARIVQATFNREVQRHLHTHYWSKGIDELPAPAPSPLRATRVLRESGLGEEEAGFVVSAYSDTLGSVDAFVDRIQEEFPYLQRTQILRLRISLEDD